MIILFLPSILDALDTQSTIYIQEIKYLGNQRISNQTIDMYVTCAQNSEITHSDINTIIKRLYNTQLFANVTAYIDDHHNLIIKIQENPLINNINFKGNHTLNNNIIMENVIKSQPFMIFNNTRLQQDLLNISARYREYGKLNVKIVYEINTLDNNMIDISVTIQEGISSRILDIKYIGNKNFSRDQLTQVMNLQDNNVFSKLFYIIFQKDNYYSSKKIEIQKHLIESFYLENGYLRNNIQYIAEVDRNHHIVLTFLIDEGSQYLFGNINIEVQNLDLKKNLMKLITEKNNDIFNKLHITHTVEKMNSYLHQNGYVFAQIKPEYVERDNKIDIVYKIITNQKSYINQIIITGNERTFDQVIRSKIPVSVGDPYNIFTIKQIHDSLMESNLFEMVQIDNIIEHDAWIDLNVNVKEKNTSVFSLTGGISMPDGMFVKTNFKDHNLFGTGKELEFSLEKNQHAFLTDIKISKYHFNDSHTKLGIGLFCKIQDKLNTDFSSYDIGFSTQLSYLITEHFTNLLHYSYRLNLINVLNNSQQNSQYTQKVHEQYNQNIISSIGYTLLYSTLDNPFVPKKGYLFRVHQDIAGLGGNITFLKSELLSFYTHSIFRKIANDINIRFKVEAGHIFSYTDQALHVTQYFFKGGNEIRGFEHTGIGPRMKDSDHTALGGKTYFNLTQQVDFPLLTYLSKIGVKGSFFIDYATLFGLDYIDKKYQHEYNDSKLMRIAPGFGISLPSPFGRLRLDFGFPILKTSYDIISSHNIKFSIESGI
ncbi:outer membrane protein assembly factor BamA [Wolbachia endosymbiont of Howardula sp.]|uniref:outer membrane protein assembly factor BamA n=1 Tax=Wolbachia endosymbiont of Howardula sp. TaxID=2916816 RepID=UPI00217DA37A|nr:outer membrane protein assembly factor BamA [Wolbachia endosymbiont of Howardula sp.]UWI83247.1 outer membrane protein assembly factor BamA [Wolbachia endosymbiont of Howardula sp.]